MCIYLIVARQRLGREDSVVMNTRKSMRSVGGLVFYTVRMLSKESRRLCLTGNSCYVLDVTKYGGIAELEVMYV
jgi:hypothetical protein